jgi:glyoxylase-like metal-dependent hydrolase (beta-lactamase superfamily II)
MNTERCTFRVGEIACVALNDGVFPYSAPLFFPGAPPDELAGALARHGLQPEPIASPWTCMLLETGQRRVLLDAGSGPMGANAVPGAGMLLQRLRDEGVAPESIDTVVLSHGHPDHIGGLTDGEGRLSFPNAEHVMWRTEWEYWTDEATLGALEASEDHLQHLLASFARANLPPIGERLRLLDRDTEIAPGLEALAAPGHTPGHMAVAVTSGTSQLLYLADTAIHPLHLEHPEWHPVFDVLPDQAAQSKRRLFDRAAADKALVHAFHFPFPGLGHVAQTGKGWDWQPA